MKRYVLSILIVLIAAMPSEARRILLIAEVFYDTPLNESRTESPAYNGEYVKLINVSTSEIDLSEYSIEFKGNKEIYRYEFPNTAILPAGGVAIVYYGDDGGFSFEELFTGWVADELHTAYKHNKFYMSNTKGELKLIRNGFAVDIMEYGENSGLEAKNGEGKPVEECVALHRDFYYAENDAGTFCPEEYSCRTADPYDNDIEKAATVNDGYIWWMYDEYRPGTLQQNFVATAIPTEATDAERNITGAIETVEYFDGLGRSLETVDVAAGGDGGDVAGYREYDGMGNVVKEFIPVPVAGTGNGAYVNAGDYASAAGFYGAETPYKEYFYESTAAPRVTESVAEGTAWHSHGGVTTEYALNTSSGELACVHYEAVKSSSGTALEKDGNYGASQLRVVKTKDEDGVTTLTFTDFLDRTVLVRQTTDSGYADTYYVYDNYGQLAYILPPELSDELKSRGGTVASDDDLMDKYAFIYEYDHRNRCTGKKLPGADWVRMVYDNSDLLIASEDGNQRQEGRHTVHAYDRLGRLAYSAEIDGAISGADAGQGRVAFASGGWIYGYDCPGEQVDEEDVLAVNYYDDYEFLDLFTGHKTELSYRSMNGYDGRFVSPLDDRSSALGMLTGRLTACGDSVTVEAFYYDYAGRVIQSHSSNHLGGYEHVYLALSFTGNPVRELREHTPGEDAEAISVLKEYEYDGRDRLAKVTHRIGNGETRVLLKNSYDALGRLERTEMGGSGMAVDYAYNVRGWLTGVDSEWFSQRLYYENTMGGGTPCFNGNISMEETTYAPSSYDTNEITYWRRHTYDTMNRLSGSEYEEMAARPSPADRPVIYVNEPQYSTSYGYDLNSNIVTLRRDGLVSSVPVDGTEGAYRQWTFGLMDELTAAYDGNRLLKVTDAAGEVVYGGAFDFNDGADGETEYEYDSNGNMTADLNRSIRLIEYDVNNRPVSVTFSTSPAEQRTKYLRDASGRKLRTEYQISRFASLVPGDLEHVDTSELNPGIWNHIEMGDLCPLSSPYIGGAVERWDGDEVQPADNLLWSTDFTRDYCGDIIYKDGEIERILTDNGYAAPDVRTGEYKYYYYVKDYQGNIRAVLDEENNVVESNGYYPYGMPYADNYFSVQPYKYGSKELDRTNGLDLYDFESRQYDPVVPRFTTIDPLAEKYPSISPYAYCAGNPIRFVDPDGKDWNDAQEILSESYSINVSIGFMANLNVKLGGYKIGAGVDIGSTTIISYENGEKKDYENNMSKGASIGIGIVSYENEKTAIEKDNYGIVEDKNSINIGSLSVGTKSVGYGIKTPDGQWHKMSEEKTSISTPTINSTIEAGLGINVKVEFNMEKLWNAIKALFK